MVKACAQVWGGEDTSRTPLLKRCLRAIFYLLAERELTLLEATDLLRSNDPDGIRAYLTSEIRDPQFRATWEEFNSLARSRRDFNEQFSSTHNRLDEFLSAPIIRSIVGQRQHVIDFRRCMDEGDVVLVNLAPSNRLSIENARVLGTLIVNDLFLKVIGRPPASRPFYLYIDECYQFLNEDIESILDQARKFGLHLILAHQRLGQLRKAGESVYNAVMTGAQTKVIFGGLEADDAELMARNVFLGEFDLEEPKHTFDKPVLVGHEPVWLRSESESEGISLSRGLTESTGTSASEALAETAGANDDPVSRSISTGAASSQSLTHSESLTSSNSRTSGRSETLKPVLRTLPTQGYSLQELVHRAMVSLVNQEPRQAIVKIPGERSERFETPEVRDGYAREERVERFKHEALTASEFARPLHVVEQELADRFIGLRQQAAAHLEILEPIDFKEPVGRKRIE